MASNASTAAKTFISPVPDASVIPDEMLNAKSFLAWKYLKTDDGKLRKLPFYVNGKPRAKGIPLDSPEDVAQLATFSDATSLASRPNAGWAGIGFAVRSGLNVGGIDLDNCLDKTGAIVDPTAQQVFAVAVQSGCYCEISPSGMGLRIIGQTTGFENFAEPGGEAYCCKRYLTITGNCYANEKGFGDIDPAVRLLHTLIFQGQSLGAAPAHVLGVVTNIPAEGYVPPDHVKEGGRNDAVLRYCGHLRGKGVSEDLILGLAQDFNKARCDPPLDDEEVKTVVERYQKLSPSVDPADWPEPAEVEPGLPAVKPFDLDMLPSAFRDFAEDQSELMQAPPDYFAVTLMVAAGAVLGNGWAVAPKAQDESWKVSPVLWGGLVGKPGVKKSPVIAKVHALLKPVEEAMRSAYQFRLLKYQSDKLMYDAAVARMKRAVNSGQPIPPFPIEPVKPEPERLVINDATVQKIGDLHLHSTRGLLLLMDELMSHLEKLKEEGQETARAFFLQAWNGNSSYAIDRIGRGSLLIDQLAVWIVGGIQPSKLQSYVRQATMGGSGDDGLLQRYQLIVWPDVSKDWKIVDRPANLTAADEVKTTFQYLRNLDAAAANACVSTGGGPAFFHFTPKAQAAFDDCWTKMEKSVRADEQHPALAAHYSKYASMLPAIALIIHLADKGTGPIRYASFSRAWRWVMYLKSHALRVYSAATNAGALSAHALAKKLKAGELDEGFTAREVERKSWSKLATKDEVRAAIEWLEDADWLRPEAVKPPQGREKTIYHINPRIFTA